MKSPHSADAKDKIRNLFERHRLINRSTAVDTKKVCLLSDFADET